MRYQEMNTYWNKSTDSPVIFLMIGGEAKISGYWVSDPNIQYLQWAKHFGALVYQTEHRFFGESQPLKDMSTDNLKYCTTKQALADLANFIKYINNKKNFKNPRWVTFGGSYPGSMAAWFRSKYPELTVGSVASSAPLYLKLDFNEYTLVMQNTIKNVSLECANAVNNSFDALSKMALTTAGRASLSKIFNAKPAFDDKTVTKLQLYNFFSNIFGAFQDIIQYTYDGLGPLREKGLTVQNLCSRMTSTTPSGYAKSSPEDLAYRVNSVVDDYNKGMGLAREVDNDYQSTISSYQNVSFDSSNAAGRGWMWLCCNEIGFLQTTELGYNIFHDLVPMNYYMQQCTDMFGKTVGPDFVRDHNDATQKYYGGIDYFNATNLVLPNGSLDPWHALGYYKADTQKHVVPHLIQGTAHCGDMYADYKDERTAAELKKVHAVILGELKYYLKSD
uniref:Serine protease K12H4.7 n=1 Tax=Steinernema glaseri TaxID=37863 RepID=A0A1I8A632_9BILA